MRKNIKKQIYLLTSLTVIASFTFGCSTSKNDNNISPTPNVTSAPIDNESEEFDGTIISLSDTGVQVNGEDATNDSNNSVVVDSNIVYYEEGHDDTYGAGSQEDAHSTEEAAKHTVVTITKPGTYKVSGQLSYGQIAIDLGEDAKDNPEDVVTLILDNASINCTVAPGIIVYNAYECGDDNEETATKDVDTVDAGFNLVLADDSKNEVNGAYVSKIYKEGTTDKLHKYDAAIESKVSFNINGETQGNGKLTVNATNEGIESHLHLTINGGEITINSADDAINTNEDNVSVLTINDGIITCDSGSGSEGDGIDSNGYIVINGGYTIASANGQSADSGVDSDLGIYINGGTLLATGNMYDEISSDSTQNFVVLGFNEKKADTDLIMIKDENDDPVVAFNAVNDYTMLVYSSPELTDANYTLYQVSSVAGDLNGSIYTNITEFNDPVQLQYTSTTMMGPGGGMFKPNDGERPALPNGEAPENMVRPENSNQEDGQNTNALPPTSQDANGEASNGFDPNSQGANGEAPNGFDPNSQGTNGQAPNGFDPNSQGTNGQAPNISNSENGQPSTDGNQDNAMQRPENSNDGENATTEPSIISSISKSSYMFSGISKVTEEK